MTEPLLSNDWSSKVFTGFHLNINDNLKLNFIKNLKNNEPLDNILDMRIKNLSIENFPFYLFPNLKFINLNEECKLDSLTNLFLYCNKIQCINFYNIFLNEIPNDIENLKLLQIFSVSSTNIISIPETIGKCIFLEDINLSNNKSLSSLPLSLKNCPFLKSITISYCNFSEFPKILHELENLIDLDISYNNIKEIPSEISNLKNLEYLKCNNTKIVLIPKSIKECKNLKDLNFRNSLLEKLPEEIGDLKKLIYMDLRETKIKELPNRIGDCSSLEIIDLERTYLDSLPIKLIELKKIKKIYTKYTPFNQKNEIIFLDTSRDGEFIIEGNYRVKYISSFQNERENKIKYIMSQENFIIPDKYKCNICFEIFKIPRTTIEGNTYCKDCILRWFSTENTDPNINKVIENKRIFPHYLFENDLNQFIDDSYKKCFKG